MKRILLTSTAAVALVALAAPGAMAQGVPAGKFQVTIGGASSIEYGFFDSKLSNQTGHEFRNDTEVHVRANATADNGLMYGVHIEIESGAANLDYDEAGIYVSGNFGRIEAGDEDGASDVLAVYAPAVGINQLDGDFDLFSSSGAGGNIGGRPSVSYFKVPDSSDATKITYFTPVFSGFQAGISYAPQGTQNDSVIVTNPVGLNSDYVEGGIVYKNTFGGISVATSVTAGHAYGNSTSVAATRNEYTAWAFGGKLGYAGFKIGGSYVDQGGATIGTGSIGNAATAPRTAGPGEDPQWRSRSSYNIGGTYTTGPVGVGIQYGSLDTSFGNADAIAVGGNYVLAPGLQIAADYVHWTNDAVRVNRTTTNPNGSKDDGDTFLIMTKVTF
jgi:hypothetical protein